MEKSNATFVFRLLVTMISSTNQSITTVSSIGRPLDRNKWLQEAYLWPAYPLTTLFRLARYPFWAKNRPIPSLVLVTMAPNQGGRKAGKGNYGKEETQFMLDVLKEILLIGPDEW